MTRFRRYSIIGFFLCATAAVWAESLLYSQNTPFNDGRWYPGGMEYGLEDRRNTLLSRATFAGNTLNLVRYQVLLTRENAPARSIAFEALLDELATLTMIFNSTEGEYSAIAFRKNESPAYVFFRATRAGKFLERRELGPPESQPVMFGWFHVEIEDQTAGLLLRINGEAVGIIENRHFSTGELGFSGSEEAVRIRNLTINYKNGSMFGGSFRNSALWGRAFQFNLMALALMAAILLFFYGEPGTLRFTGRMLLLSILWLAFDFFALSPDSTTNPTVITLEQKAFHPTWQNRLDTIRESIFSRWHQMIGGPAPISTKGFDAKFGKVTDWSGMVYCHRDSPQLAESCAWAKNKEAFDRLVPAKKKAFRFLVLGGSYSVGYGALDFSSTFFVRLYEQLLTKQRARPETRDLPPLDGINYSMARTNFLSLSDSDMGKIIAFRPDVVLVSSFYLIPDKEEKITLASLAGRLRKLSAEGAEVILLGSIEERLQKPGETYHGRTIVLPAGIERIPEAALEDTALSSGAAFHGIPGFFADNPELLRSGVIWIDRFHMTGFGQNEFAAWLAPKIFERLLAKFSR